MKLFRIATLAVCAPFVILAQQAATTYSGCPVFPANNIWNTPIDTLPLAAHSADYINSISATATLRYDISFPINVVPGTQPLVPLNIGSPDESDPGPYPFPATAQVEYGSDLHVIVLDKDHCMLYETYNSSLQANGSWNVDSAAKWSLLSNALRPAYWTSADAAGLPIMAGLLRYDEVASGTVTHPIRFTAPQTQRLFVWPARHYASTNTSALLPPMGQRFRLKAGFDISPYSPNVQTILRAMKKYGIILADNGLPWEMQFAIDPRWNTTELDTLRNIAGSNLEAVDVSGLTIDPNSGQAAPPGVPAVTVTPGTALLGPAQTKQFTATINNSTLGVSWSITPQTGSITAAGLYTAPAAVSAAQTVTVTATLSGGAAAGSATITLLPAAPPSIASVALGSASIVGGNNASVTVTLTGAAPSTGASVTLAGSNSTILPVTMMVPAGAVFQTFSVPTYPVIAATPVTVTASYYGTSAVSSTLTVNPPPVTVPPVISAVAAGNITSSGATITWTTSTAADSQVAYGTTTGYGSLSPLNSTLMTSHSVMLSGLAASTAYHYQVMSRDAQGNLATSGDYTFTTAAPTSTTLLQIHADASEVSGVTNGSVITPGVAPAGFSGTVVVKGTGSVNYAPAQVGNGVYFLNCCANSNNAYYKFTGSAIGNIFHVNQGQISFYLKSRYSFAQRKASAAPARYAFDVRDGNGTHLFSFQTHVGSNSTGSFLNFTYVVAGSSQYYIVPAGTEDALFGSGVILQVTLKWDGAKVYVYLNGSLVKSTAYTVPTPNWSSASNFDFGAYEYLSYGGYDSCDDIIDEFTVQ